MLSTNPTQRCRSCSRLALAVFLDLGGQPLAGWFPEADEPEPDVTWPLRPAVCTACWLVQTAYEGPAEYELPGAPSPLSSATMARHARELVRALVARGWARRGSRVVEVASHAGHLQPFFAVAGIATIALEPDPARARRLVAAGGKVVTAGALLDPDAEMPVPAGTVDLFVDHYLLAHLDAPEAALETIGRLLTPDGVAVLEFDHLLPTIQGLQFDAFRHGHRSYLSLTWLADAAERHGMTVRGAAEQSVYGGALRVYLRRRGTRRQGRSTSVGRVLAAERLAGLGELDAYAAFAEAVSSTRAATVHALGALARDGHPMVGYGAPARAVTLLNYYGLDTGVLPLIADASPAKQGRFMPGVRVPIVPLEELSGRRPADVLILAWDLAPEIIRQLESGGGWGARYWVPIPGLRRAIGRVPDA